MTETRKRGRPAKDRGKRTYYAAYSVRLSPADAEKLDEIQRRSGYTITDFFRIAVNKAYASLVAKDKSK